MPKFRISNPQGQTLEIDSPDGSTPSEQEIDQMFAKAYPQQQSGGLWDKFSGAVDWATTPITEHIGKAVGLDPSTTEAIMHAVGGGPVMGHDPTGGLASYMATNVSPLDVATAPAMMASKAASPALQAAVRGGRFMEIAGGLGISAQGAMEIKNAIQSGDLRSIPSGVLKAIMGAAMAKPQATRAVDNALKDLDEVAVGTKVWDPEVTESITTGVEEEALARMVDDAQSELWGSGAKRATHRTVARMLGVSPENTRALMPILQQRGVLLPEGNTGSFRIIPEARPGGPLTTSMEEKFAQKQGEALEAQGKKAISSVERKPTKARGHEPERPTVEKKFQRKGLREEDKALKSEWDQMMEDMKGPSDDPLAEDREIGNWTRMKAEYPHDGPAIIREVQNPRISSTRAGKTTYMLDPSGVVDTELGQKMLEAPHTQTLLGKYENLVRIIQGNAPGATPISVEGVLVDPHVRGVNVSHDPRLGNKVFPALHTMVGKIERMVQQGKIPREKAPMYLAARLKANAIHEAAHAKNLMSGRNEHGELFKFLQAENRRAASITRGSFYNPAEWKGLYDATLDDAKSIFRQLQRAKRGVPEVGGYVPDGGDTGRLSREFDRGGEAGAVASDLPKTLGRAALQGAKEGGDLMRASLAGDLGVAIRNVESGGRMILKGAVGSKGAATIARMRAARESLIGNTKRASELRAAAQRHDEVAKAYGSATLKSAVSTFSDALSFMTKGKIEPKWGDPGKFGEQLEVMSELGQKKLSDKLKAFSSAEVTTESGSKTIQKIKKGLMFFNIMGDRFINKTFLTAHMDALQGIYGLSSPKAVLRLAEQNPGLKTEIEDFLEKAGAEAFRASWQNVSPSGTLAKKVTRLLDNTPGGIVVQPFAKAFLSNMLPNIVESWGPLAFASKRVRNSFEHEALRNAWKTLREEGSEASMKRAAHLRAKMRKLEMDGIYDTNMIYSRMLMGPLVVAAAVARRVASGDDGTNFDETAIQVGPDGKATTTASFASQAGEDLPAWLLGDMLGHEILSKKTGKASKYDGPAGQVYVGEMLKGIYGSRYGYNSPLLNVVADVIKGQKKISTELLGNTAETIMEDLGRMAGQGAWLGSGARLLAGKLDPGENVIRRSDVTESKSLSGRLGESFKEGVQAQVPVWKKELPESISWPKLRHSTKAQPLESITGGGGQGLDQKPISRLLSLVPGMTRREISEIERFAEDQPNSVSLSEILPRRSQDPEFDELMLAEFKKGAEKKLLPILRSGRLDSLTMEEKAAWWHKLSSIREDAEKRAKVQYKKMKGQLPQRYLDEKAEEKKKKLTLRDAKRKLRGLPTSSPPSSGPS